MEARGKQDLWVQTKPDVLEALRELAIIQSAESSNRIEGVVVNKARLLPLLQGKVPPRDRSEEEVFGYQKALNWIHINFNHISISPDTIKHLHYLSQSGFSGDAGEWQRTNNEIIEILPTGERVIRFVPVKPENTQNSINQLCLSYIHTQQDHKLPDLLSVAAFILDFLCIHPFRDGNGRVARLLSLLLLYQNGYIVGKYVSLERIVEQTKQDYYETLRASSINWHEGCHDLLPFINYFLGLVRESYKELAERVSVQQEALTGKSELIRKSILSKRTPFSLKEITGEFQSVSPQLTKKIL